MTPATPGEIAARLDRLPPSRTVWTMVALISNRELRHRSGGESVAACDTKGQ